jgi:flagellin
MTRIMTNVSAINGQRNLAKTDLKMGKILEKLASGYRINRAADDAAGLAISEKMRAQIRGNQQALRNSQDGISMLQTAEGAMDEVHTILQRMRELAVQAANGTYADNGPERTSIGEEIVQLRQEIDRISYSTEFNGQKVLTGNLSVALGSTGIQNGQLMNGVGSGTMIGAATLQAGVGVNAPTTFGSTLPGSYTIGMNGSNVELRQGTTVVATANAATLSIAAASTGNLVFSNGLTLTINNAAGPNPFTVAQLSADLATAKTFNVAGTQITDVGLSNVVPQSYTFSVGVPNTLTLTGADGSTQTVSVPALTANEVRTIQFNNLGISVTLTNGSAAVANPETLLGGQTIDATGSGSTSTLQVGANVPDTLTLDFVSMQSDQLGSAAFKLGGTTGLITTLGTQVVKTIQDSHNLMSALDGAIQTLNSRRGTLGAAQNRLEHTINSLGVAVENLTASESRIRDADVAELSSDLVASNILQQAGVSVLSQANQTPQAVLQLLRQ